MAFDYDKDFTGSGCPIGAHARRMNPRGGLEFGRSGAFHTRGALTNRRRLLRRGFPYGQREDTPTDDGDRGVIIMILGASIRRQFEFVQQQWLNYGNDFKLGNDKDPLVGNHGDGKEKGSLGRMVIESRAGLRQAAPSVWRDTALCRNPRRRVLLPPKPHRPAHDWRRDC